MIITSVDIPPPPYNNDDDDQPTFPPASDTVFRTLFVDTNGVVWDFNDGPVAMMTTPERLFGTPTVQHWWNTSPGVPGSRWAGMDEQLRENVNIPIRVAALDWLSWRDVDGAFFNGLDPAKLCRIYIVAPDGRARSLGLRYESGGDLASGDRDPLLDSRAYYTLGFVAENPYWVEETISYTWVAQAPTPMYPFYPLVYNAPSTSDAATVTNPGNVDSPPIFTATGPCASFRVGVGGAIVGSSIALAAGEQRIIDMTPGEYGVVDQFGTNHYEDMNLGLEFAPIPAGAQVPLTVSVGGAGAGAGISVSFQPRYRRPWGPLPVIEGATVSSALAAMAS